ncbi:hypothetical protein DDI74_11170 [Chryseobacterium gleum]|uniref:hypothetical protein n=1 Tax=Chryseobacterium gleum TaxID=250 RepID=UPI0010395F91|nr:hypothetical protein [Chryseobacterium gleum]QBJ86785.1 hypothetical protein DDI74_11170 [Chryseobacterium gleum]
MKNKFILRLSLLIIFTFFLHSCRSEDFLKDEKAGDLKYKVSILNKEQINREKLLLKELSQVKSKFRYKTNVGIDGKAAQNDILDGAIIGTNQALLVESNGVKTYTFPVSRTYLSRKTENLIVKENSDHTFSGVLIQYDLTKEQQQKFISGEITDIKSKISIYDIDKLNINTTSRVQTDVVGCYKITWETGWCSAGIHQTGSDNTCTVGGAPAPMIISIEETCSQTGGGTGGGTGDGGLGQVGAGGVIDLGGYYNTLPFVSLGYQYYETEDPFDPNYVHYTNVANYFQSLGNTLNQLRVTNPDLFYYAFFYFKEKGITIKSKSFITERLTGLNEWYIKANSNPGASEMNNQYFLNWAFEYLVLNPNVTWQEFYNEYLATPCEKTSIMLNRPNVQQGITDVKAQAQQTLSNTNTGEIGFKEKKDGTVVPADVTSAHQVVFNDTTDGYGGYHNHTASGIHMFSPPDIVDTLFGFAAAQSVNDGVENAYFGMIAAEWCNTCPGGKKEIHYVIRYAGTGTELGKFVYSPARMAQIMSKYLRKANELTNTSLNGNTYRNSAGDLNEKGLEKLFFDTLTNIGIGNKVVLQRVEPNGTVYNITQDSSGSITSTPCP